MLRILLSHSLALTLTHSHLSHFYLYELMSKCWSGPSFLDRKLQQLRHQALLYHIEQIEAFIEKTFGFA